MRKLFTKGLKYRENNKTSWKGVKSCIMEGFNDCVDTYCNKHGNDKSIFKEWKIKLKKIYSTIDLANTLKMRFRKETVAYFK